jgi:hypothetical protein
MNRNLKFFIYFYIFVFCLTIIVFKLFGYPDRYGLVSSYPYSWKEIYQILPTIAFKTLLISILCTIFYSQAKKNEDWRIEQARKRIAEREKQAELEKQQEVIKNDDENIQ